MGRLCLSVFLIVTLVSAPVFAQDDEDERPGAPAVDVIFDVFVLRSLGAVQTAVGLGFFAIAGPLAAPSGSAGEAWDVFVRTPYEETFTRPLGRF